MKEEITVEYFPVNGHWEFKMSVPTGVTYSGEGYPSKGAAKAEVNKLLLHFKKNKVVHVNRVPKNYKR